jgi:hypothetical protein
VWRKAPEGGLESSENTCILSQLDRHFFKNTFMFSERRLVMARFASIILLLMVSVTTSRAAITGTVTDVASMPVSNARVAFINESNPSFQFSAVTDASGRYEIPLLTGVGDESGYTPQSYFLGQNFPNPFNPSTIIPFTLHESGFVTLSIYSIAGQRIQTLINGFMTAGHHTVSWKGEDAAGRSVSAGIYLYQLRMGGKTSARKMLLLDGGSPQGAASAVVTGGLALKPAGMTCTVNVTGANIQPFEQKGLMVADGEVYNFLVPVSFTIDSISLADTTLLRFASTGPKYPAGFYNEDLGDASIYYENTLSILPLGQRIPSAFELSTDNRDQAFAWSESSAVNSSDYRMLQSERETERFFEFRRVNQNNPKDIILSRVHKSSYIDRSMYDKFNPSPIVAQLNARPIDTETVRTLVEFFWFIDNYELYGAKVLQEVTSQSPDSILCALYHIQVVFGDWGISDRIYLYRSLYSVSTQSGIVSHSETTVRDVYR